MARKPALTPELTPERAAALAKAAASAGARWAGLEREALHAEGRRAEGGWPGRLSQAKDWIRRAVDRSTTELSPDEESWMARTIYDCARRAWLARQDPPDPAQAAG